MQNFKHYYLQEENNSDKKRIKEIVDSWREQQKEYFNNDRRWSSFGRYKIVNGPEGYGIEHLGKELNIYKWMLNDEGYLSVKFYKADNVIIGTRILSFKNFPDIVTAENKVGQMVGGILDGHSSALEEVSSLEGISSTINGQLQLASYKKLNYSNVHKYIKSCQIILIDKNYVGPLLGFLKIKNLRGVNPYMLASQTKGKAEKAIDILNTHIKKHDLDKDILACQDELIENGLKEYAKF